MFEVANALGGTLALMALTLGIMRYRKGRQDQDRDPHEFI